MSDRDAAFLWETEALRASPRRGEVSDRPTPAPDAEPHWVTLREGHHLTGIPIETLRKWARKDAVPTFLSESEIGVRRMIRMDAVRERAARLGRPIAPIPRPPAPRAAPAAAAVPAPEPPPAAEPETELTGGTSPAEVELPVEAPTAASEAPPGTMIVPIAAWDKMLMQLGNLHQAGQQLAEARERAAKAETEAAFLRERLGELRKDLAESRAAAPAPTSDTPAPSPSPAAEPEATAPPRPAPQIAPRPEKLWRYIYRGWRQRRR